MDEDGNKKNVEVEKLPLIDMSSEDDFLVASPFRDTLEDFRLSDFSEVQNVTDVIGQREQKLLLSESMESGTAINLRKSLAWDSAFFTSAGVLDPEELSIIHKGFGRTEGHILPEIREDVRMRPPADSDSTLDSDGFSLESTEVDLFEDVRASIQRSSKMSIVAGAGIQNIHSLKKLDVGSRMVKSMPASRLQGSEKIKKEASVGRQIVKHTARSGESNSASLKPPGINPVSARRTKSASLGAYHAKMENRTAKSGSGHSSMVSKKSGFEDSCTCTIRSTPSPKSSSVSFTCTDNLTISCSSHGKSGGPSSKSSSNSLRRKTYSTKTKMDVSVSTSHTPARYSARSKIGLENLSSFSSHYKSISSCTSLASSIDGCSSGSSSSASTANRRSTKSESILNITSCRGAYLGNGATQALQLQNHPHYQASLREESQPVVQNPSRGTDTVAAKSTRNFKPSGLRMPSPKIGFFDEEKYMVPAVRGSSQFEFEVQSAFPYIERDTNNKTCDMLQPVRTLPETRDMKLGSQQTGVLHPSSGMKPRNAARFQELNNASLKVSGTSRTKRNCLGTSLEAQIDTSPAVGREKCLKTRKVTGGGLDARNFSPHSSLREERKGNEWILKNKIDSKGHVRLRGNKISTNKGETGVRIEDINPFKKEHEESSQYHPENDMHLLQNAEKEILSDFEDQVNGLRKYLEVIDLSKDLVTEPKRKRGYSYSHFCDNYLENNSAPVFSSFATEQILRGQQQEDSLNILSKHNPLSLPTTVEFIPSTRTPLAEKNSVCNRIGLFGGLTESTTEKAVEKASTFPFYSIEKENS